jgi:hypothetical protein
MLKELYHQAGRTTSDQATRPVAVAASAEIAFGASRLVNKARSRRPRNRLFQEDEIQMGKHRKIHGCCRFLLVIGARRDRQLLECNVTNQYFGPNIVSPSRTSVAC